MNRKNAGQMGAIYQTTPGLTMTNMAPLYIMPETPFQTMPARVVDQVIPGTTTNLPTPTQPTVYTSAAIVDPAQAGQAAPAPWYQWFLDHPVASVLIGIAGVIVIREIVKPSKKRTK
jgi:hypothetical protein